MSSCTAGIIVIGDEILKGITKDTNSYFVSKKLYSMGVSVKKISVIPDDVAVISKEVSEFSKSYDVVITSGGIGPTHDDVTYDGVAKAFGENLELHLEMADAVKSYYPGEGLSIEKNPALKMAYLPKSSTLIKNNYSSNLGEDFPIVRVFNVLLFPGIPQLLEGSFSQLELADLFPALRNDIVTRRFHCYRLYLLSGEVELVSTLDKAVAKFGDCVNFGSYPDIENRFYSTLITVESVDELLAVKALEYLRKEMPNGVEVPPPPGHDVEIINYNLIAKKSSERVYQLLLNRDAPKALIQHLKQAIKIIEACFCRYDPATEVFISFNGGKDCTALLHLVFAVITKRFPNGFPLRSLYIRTKDPFPELEDFVNKAATRYDLKLYMLQGPLKKALQEFVNEHSSCKAVLIGTRRTDPKSVSLEPFQMTDGDWPKLMRVSPLLDWSYEDVWTFLRILSVPYCGLYDQGYTSIGDRDNTFPNPKLEFVGEDGQKCYHPAYTLKDGASERSGRQCGALNSVAELTSSIAEVIASAFGPNGRAVLFARGSISSSSITGAPSIISRSGLEILEILASKNECGTVHPLLKPLIDTCRRLEGEWGDGVKSLVIMTSELLRQCASLDSQRPGWLRMELEKALMCFGEVSKVAMPFTSSFHCGTSHCTTASACPHKKDDPISPVENLVPLTNDSKFTTGVDEETYKLLQMFFATRFPSHVCDVVPPLLFEWINNLEKGFDMYPGGGFEFVINNFCSLCHVDAGLSTDQCCLLKGVVFHGVGVGRMFETKATNLYKDLCCFSDKNNLTGAVESMNSPSSSLTLPIRIKIITENELAKWEPIKKSCNQPNSQFLYLTSCIVTELMEFKIRRSGNVSLIHSVSKDDLDFIHCLFCHPTSEQDVDASNIKWVRKWSRGRITSSPGLMWLGVPNIESLILSVPAIGMAEGIKRACWSALRLIHQFRLHSAKKFRGGCENLINQQNLGPVLEKDDSHSFSHSSHSTLQFIGDLYPVAVNLLPVGSDFCTEKLLPNCLLYLKVDSLVVAGGLAEVLLHDMVTEWWLVPPLGCHHVLDRSVAKAISQACLSVPRCLSSSNNITKKPFKTLWCTFSSDYKELMVHRLRILHCAVSVVNALSNISDVLCISKRASQMKLSSNSRKE